MARLGRGRKEVLLVAAVADEEPSPRGAARRGRGARLQRLERRPAPTTTPPKPAGGGTASTAKARQPDPGAAGDAATVTSSLSRAPRRHARQRRDLGHRVVAIVDARARPAIGGAHALGRDSPRRTFRRARRRRGRQAEARRAHGRALRRARADLRDGRMAYASRPIPGVHRSRRVWRVIVVGVGDRARGASARRPGAIASRASYASASGSTMSPSSAPASVQTAPSSALTASPPPPSCARRPPAYVRRASPHAPPLTPARYLGASASAQLAHRGREREPPPEISTAVSSAAARALRERAARGRAREGTARGQRAPDVDGDRPRGTVRAGRFGGKLTPWPGSRSSARPAHARAPRDHEGRIGRRARALGRVAAAHPRRQPARDVRARGARGRGRARARARRERGSSSTARARRDLALLAGAHAQQLGVPAASSRAERRPAAAPRRRRSRRARTSRCRAARSGSCRRGRRARGRGGRAVATAARSSRVVILAVERHGGARRIPGERAARGARARLEAAVLHCRCALRATTERRRARRADRAFPTTPPSSATRARNRARACSAARAK